MIAVSGLMLGLGTAAALFALICADHDKAYKRWSALATLLLWVYFFLKG